MICLDEKQLKPLIVLQFCTLGLITMGIFFALLMSYSLTLLIVLLLFVFSNIVIVVLAIKDANNNKKYMEVDGNSVVLIVKNEGGENNNRSISLSSITMMKYYKFTSLRAWLLSFVCGCLVPKSVYIVYAIDNIKKEELLGYLDYDTVINIAQKHNIKLTVY